MANVVSQGYDSSTPNIHLLWSNVHDLLANLQAGSQHIEANPTYPSVLFSQANWYLFHSCPAPT